jgi:hypothetical protein
MQAIGVDWNHGRQSIGILRVRRGRKITFVGSTALKRRFAMKDAFSNHSFEEMSEHASGVAANAGTSVDGDDEKLEEEDNYTAALEEDDEENEEEDVEDEAGV